MIHAFWHAIGWHAGSLAFQLAVPGAFVLGTGLYARHLLRRLKRSMHRGGEQ